MRQQKPFSQGKNHCRLFLSLSGCPSHTCPPSPLKPPPPPHPFKGVISPSAPTPYHVWHRSAAVAGLGQLVAGKVVRAASGDCEDEAEGLVDCMEALEQQFVEGAGSPSLALELLRALEGAAEGNVKAVGGSRWLLGCARVAARAISGADADQQVRSERQGGGGEGRETR